MQQAGQQIYAFLILFLQIQSPSIFPMSIEKLLQSPVPLWHFLQWITKIFSPNLPPSNLAHNPAFQQGNDQQALGRNTPGGSPWKQEAVVDLHNSFLPF